MVENDHIKGQNLTKNLDFQTYIWPFGAENTAKSRPFKTKKDALTLPKQFQNNFEKVLKTTFWTPKVTKSRMPILQKVSIFRIFLLYELFFGSLYWKKNVSR